MFSEDTYQKTAGRVGVSKVAIPLMRDILRNSIHQNSTKQNMAELQR
jgi:hypothetical protein